MASRINLARASAAVLGVSVALMVGAIPASAGTPGTASNSHGHDAISAQIDPTAAESGPEVKLKFSKAEGGASKYEPVGLNTLDLSQGAPVQAYCIDLTTLLHPKLTVWSEAWSQFTGPSGSTFRENSQYINWILLNSYPTVTKQKLPELAKAAGITDTLSTADAISGTQAAIWHYSDGATLEQADADVTALYDYLIGSANVGVDESALEITPPSNTALSADRLIGPYTVTTNMAVLKLDASTLPAGVTVTDANSNAVTSVSNGSKIYFHVASTATATSASALITGTATSGRIFVADTPSQVLIGAGKTTVPTQLAASWTATATSSSTTPTTPAAASSKTGPGLAYTGFSATGPIVLGVLLLAAGGLFLLVQRRLKRAA